MCVFRFFLDRAVNEDTVSWCVQKNSRSICSNTVLNTVNAGQFTMEETKIEKLQWSRWMPIKNEGADANPQELARYESTLHSWKRLYAKAQRIIVNALGPQPMQLIMRFNNLREMWSKLVATYEQKSDTHIHMLQHRFFSATMDSSDNIVGHIAKLEDIFQ